MNLENLGKAKEKSKCKNEKCKSEPLGANAFSTKLVSFAEKAYLTLMEKRMNKTVFAIYKLNNEPKSYVYWLQQTPIQRLEAIEFYRQQYHPDAAQSRLQRVYRIISLKVKT